MFMKFVAWQEQSWQIQQSMLTKFDKNGDGQLTGDEARQAIKPRIDMEYDRSLTALFKQCDKNNDGKFDAQELAAAKLLATKKYDRNGDGNVDTRESFQAVTEATFIQSGVEIQQFGGRGGMRGGNNGVQGGQPGGGRGGMIMGPQGQPGGMGAGQLQPGQQLQPGGRGGRGGRGAVNPADQLKRFDLDGDGKLNAEEQKRADAMQQQQRQEQVIAPPIDE
jgi:Ca2+-binding EF-hand superfamily protein